MQRMLVNVFGIFAAAVTIIVAFVNSNLSIDDQPNSFWATLAIAGLLAIGLILCEIVVFFREKPKRYQPNSDHIRDYMVRWLSGGGRALILSRDLTWVTDIEQKLLLDKARNGELELLIQKESAFVEALRSAGCEVYVYGKNDFAPRSRFTIIDYQKNGARVAIGRRRGSMHEITEHSEPEDIFVLVEDLKDALIAVSKNV